MEKRFTCFGITLGTVQMEETSNIYNKKKIILAFGKGFPKEEENLETINEAEYGQKKRLKFKIGYSSSQVIIKD